MHSTAAKKIWSEDIGFMIYNKCNVIPICVSLQAAFSDAVIIFGTYFLKVYRINAFLLMLMHNKFDIWSSFPLMPRRYEWSAIL